MLKIIEILKINYIFINLIVASALADTNQKCFFFILMRRVTVPELPHERLIIGRFEGI